MIIMMGEDSLLFFVNALKSKTKHIARWQFSYSEFVT